MSAPPRVIAVLVWAAFAAIGAGEAAAASKAPLGYQIMCLRTPSECRGGGAERVDATPDLLATLQKVNDWVNRSIKPQNDRGADVWDASATVGDCEDYVLVKRRRLIKAGLPPSALRIAFVETRSGVGHAVLVVNTTKEQYALDNLTRAIKPLKKTGYRVVSMQTGDPATWR